MWAAIRSFFVGTANAAPVVAKVAPAARKSGPALLLVAAAFIGGWEGLDLVAKHYAHDPAGVITYCQGLTNLSEDKKVKVGDRFTKEVCNEKFAAALPKYWEPINKCVPGLKNYPQGVQIASLSLAYNIGHGGFCKSSIARNLNAGNRKAACDAFRLYIKADGKVLKGLVNRRESERTLCLKDI
jgi:lysozyme